MRRRPPGSRVLALVRIWRALGSADRTVLVRSAILFPAVSLGLRTIGMARVQRLLHRSSSPLRISVTEARRLARLVETVARRGPMRYSCLERSLVLWHVLRSGGLLAELRLGVRREAGGDHHFHAWIEHADDVLNDVPHVRDRFEVFGSTEEREAS